MARKVWRYNTQVILEYTLSQVELELLMLFPTLQEKKASGLISTIMTP